VCRQCACGFVSKKFYCVNGSGVNWSSAQVSLYWSLGMHDCGTVAGFAYNTCMLACVCLCMFVYMI